MSARLTCLSLNVLHPFIDLPSYFHPACDPELLYPELRLASLCGILSQLTLDLDMLALQEVTPEWHKEVDRRLPHFKGFHSGGEIGTSLFIRKNKFSHAKFVRVSSNVIYAKLVSRDREFEVWSIQLSTPEEFPELNPGPGLYAVSFPKATAFNPGLENLLRKTGNFEPTVVHSAKNGIADYIFGKELQPISGDVLDFHVWSIQQDLCRLETSLKKIGSDHMPLKITFRI